MTDLQVIAGPLAIVVAGQISFRTVWRSPPALAIISWLGILYYLQWRLTGTIAWAETGPRFWWPFVCLLVELAALADAVLLLLLLAGQTDRSAEADRGEARLRACTPEDLPPVDVFIATYNEPREVLEKTILGCLALDWPQKRVWVLDDGRRVWLRDYCAERGAGYVTRPDNKGAKAGNINHALEATDAPFVAVFDADFVPRRDFLMRTMGFFEDPRIGIVQIPHSFYNHDPMQSNLALRSAMPDDQRFFFEAVMPGRDRWDAAFCCGSNSVTRRELFDRIGGGLPEGSITEDMLLTLTSLRAGYVTRYLNEPLAFGLAPESIDAFFVQRERWAQGAIQIMYLPSGPFGPGLRFIHRLLFIPSSWVTQSLLIIFGFLTPLVFLFGNLSPLGPVTGAEVVGHVLPMIVGVIGGIAGLAPGRYYAMASHVLAAFQSFRILPVVLQTLVRPKGLIFKVTPKGAATAGAGWERRIWRSSVVLIALTVVGLAVNYHPDYRIIDQDGQLANVALWSVVNVLTLLFVGMLCLERPALRSEERLALLHEVTVTGESGQWFASSDGDISVTGVGLAPRDDMDDFRLGERVDVMLREVGALPGRVVRVAGRLGIAFDLPDGKLRDRLVTQLFTSPLSQNDARPGGWEVAWAVLSRLWTADLRDTGVRVAASPGDDRRLAPASRVIAGAWTIDGAGDADVENIGRRVA